MFIRQLGIKDQAQSLRERLKKAPPQAQMMTKLLSTSSMGKLIPSLAKEYGANRPIDIMGSFSTSFIEDKLDNFSPSGIQIKKSGVVNLKLNSSC